jgi:hypothetical protein
MSVPILHVATSRHPPNDRKRTTTKRTGFDWTHEMKIHALQTGTVRVKLSQRIGRGRGPMRQLHVLFDSTWTEALPIYTFRDSSGSAWHGLRASHKFRSLQVSYCWTQLFPLRLAGGGPATGQNGATERQ